MDLWAPVTPLLKQHLSLANQIADNLMRACYNWDGWDQILLISSSKKSPWKTLHLHFKIQSFRRPKPRNWFVSLKVEHLNLKKYHIYTLIQDINFNFVPFPFHYLHFQSNPLQSFIASWITQIWLTAAKLICPWFMPWTSNSFARSDTGVVIDSEPRRSHTCKTSLSFAQLAVRVQAGWSLFHSD